MTVAPEDQTATAAGAGANWDHSSNEEFYRYYADESASEKTLQRFLSIRTNMLRLVGEERARSVLDVADVGCGAGAQCQLWAEFGHRVHGLDINEPLLELGRQRAKERGLPIEYTLGTATDLPWPDESMDVCLVPELLEHVADWESCLDEFCRVLKPGGLLFVTTTSKLCPIQQEFELPLYSWYPAALKRRYERLAVTTRPELVNHAKYPAVHWFTFYSLRDALARRGAGRALDRFDIMDPATKALAARIVLKLVRSNRLVRWLAHVATPASIIAAFKNGEPTTASAARSAVR